MFKPLPPALAYLVCLGWTLPVASQEQAAEIIASHIRVQGYTCTNPKSAKHEVGQSRPNEQVWILTCDDAVYRVTLVPDLRARVERLN